MYSSECTTLVPRGAADLATISSLIIILIGVPGNLIVILSLFSSSKLLSNPTTKFIINLAIADLIFCSINLPLTSIRYYTCSWPFGDLICHLYPFLFYSNVAVSLMSITAITINRLVSITFYRHYDTIYQKRYILIMIAFCWLFPFLLLSLPMFKLWGQFGLEPSTFSCTILRYQNGSPKKFLFLLSFFMPSLTILISYSIIWFKVMFHPTRSKDMKRKTWKRDLKMTKMIVILFLTFITCFAPLMIANVLLPQDRYPYVHIMASIMSWLNCCINPLLYFAMDGRYRSAFKQFISASAAVINSNRGDTTSNL
ncbi:protein trapped in endoderm-1-like [Panonychus citri]|uniref:protein trapped in endoderm-1-like n=1 Tax=Panonychus citri TaxID=50023 RepID=UPI002306E91E|nr:protein trapped in endoderm-1-like [Panonychus citri]